MRKALMVAIFPLMVSCATLSESQREMIHNLSVMAEDVASGPGLLVEELAEVRLERGLFYAATFTSSEIRVSELEALALGMKQDERTIAGFNAGVRFLNGYLHAVRSLSNERRSAEYGTRIRAAGRSVTSAMTALEETGWVEQRTPKDWVKWSAEATSFLTESYMKRRQMKILRDYVQAGDSLVGLCVDSMVSVLKGSRMKELIGNEYSGLKDNYLLYLKTRSLEEDPSLARDRIYLETYMQIDGADHIRRRCITSLQSFRRAHRKMVQETGRRQDITGVYEELLEFAEEAAELMEIIEENEGRKQKK